MFKLLKDMSKEEQLLWMFKQVHGEIGGACSAEVDYGEDSSEPVGVSVWKHGNKCWSVTKVDILFDFVMLRAAENELKNLK